MTQQATQQKEYETENIGDTGPSTPVVITGGGTAFPEGAAVANLTIGPAKDAPSLVFKVVAEQQDTGQWTQSMSTTEGLVKGVTLGDYSFPLSGHPVTILLFDVNELPLLTIGEIAQSETGSYRLYITSNNPQQALKEASASGDGWTESITAAPCDLTRVFVGPTHRPISADLYSIQIDFSPTT